MTFTRWLAEIGLISEQITKLKISNFGLALISIVRCSRIVRVLQVYIDISKRLSRKYLLDITLLAVQAN